MLFTLELEQKRIYLDDWKISKKESLKSRILTPLSAIIYIASSLMDAGMTRMGLNDISDINGQLKWFSSSRSFRIYSSLVESDSGISESSDSLVGRVLLWKKYHFHDGREMLI